MNAEVKDHISKCDVLQRTPTGTVPWAYEATDLSELDGQNWVILIDYYINFFEINELKKTTTQAVVNALRPHFARHGDPSKLISDNGPQYRSQEFAEFVRELGFEHVTSSPLYPQSNGKA